MRTFVTRFFKSSRLWPVDPWIVGFVVLTAGTALLALTFAALYSIGALGLLSRGWTTAHWRYVALESSFWSALGYSFALTIVTLVLATFTALAVALILNARVRRGPFAVLVYAPLAVPGIVAALLSYQIFGDAGLLSRLAFAAGWIESPAEFPALVFDRLGIGIMLTHFAMITPFFVILFDRLFENERIAELRQSAYTLGATRMQALSRVVLPLLLVRALPVCAVYGVVLMGAFEVPLLIGARYPTMMSVEIYSQFASYDLTARPQAYAMATFYLLLMLAAWSIALRWRPRPARAPR